MQGSLRQRGNRSWELRVLNGRDALSGRNAYLQETMHGTKREAETELARFVTEVGDGAHASACSCAVQAQGRRHGVLVLIGTANRSQV